MSRATETIGQYKEHLCGQSYRKRKGSAGLKSLWGNNGQNTSQAKGLYSRSLGSMKQDISKEICLYVPQSNHCVC